MPSSTAELWLTIAGEAERESALWQATLRPEGEQQREVVFSPLAEERYAVGIETIYEGYLAHFGEARLFAPEDRNTAILLGDYLYAHGLKRIEEVGSVAAVDDLAELIAMCAYLRAEAIPGDGAAWAATSALLGRGALEAGRTSLRLDNDPGPLERLAREAVGDEAYSRSLDTHRQRLR